MSHSNLKKLSLALLLATGALGAAQADDRGSKGPIVPPLPKYTQECASCHLAYPASMLPAASWQRLMGSLDKHYGTDASLDDASAKEISVWLKAHAGTYKRVSEEPPQDRISKSAWFLRKHRDGEVPAAVWKRASVGGASNCAACHSNAAQGSFSERDIKIPK
ncbi:MAG: diheme cytochrome c [Rhodoferax sp.]